MTLDLDTAARPSTPRPTSPSGIEEEFALLDPATLDARRRASRSCATPREADPVLAASIAGELISSEIEIRSGRGEDFHDALGRQRDRRRPPVRPRRRARDRARRDRHAPVGRLPRAADHRHRALPPRRGRPAVRGVAQQHVLAARPRRRARRRPRGARVRPAAPGAAAAAGDLGQLALRRRARLRPALGAHADLHQELPALRDPRRLRRAGRPTRDYIDVPGRAPTRSSSTRRSGGRCARTSTFGTVEVRICDAQAHRDGVRGARRR